MPKKKNDDWLDALIALGLGALAIYFVGKLLEGGRNEPVTTCPRCGASINKWAKQCPRCRMNLFWR